MSLGRGVDLICAAIKATTWGTATDPNVANKAFRPIAFAWEDSIEPLPDTSYNADAHNREADEVGRFRVGGAFTVEMKYEGIDELLSMFLGTSTVTGTNPYTRTLSRANDMQSKYITLEWDDGIATHTVSTAVITGVTFSGTAGNIVTAEFRWQGHKRTDAATGGLASATERTPIDRMHFLNTGASTPNVDYQIGDQGSLADIELNSWQVVMERTYDDDDRVFTSASVSAPYRREMKAGLFQVTGQLTIPHEAITHITTDLHAGTLKNLKLDHGLDGTSTWGIFLPSLTFESGTANVTDKGGIPQILNFRADMAGAAVSGFDLTVPYIKGVNTDATDYI